jgi:hypothetical protein
VKSHISSPCNARSLLVPCFAAQVQSSAPALSLHQGASPPPASNPPHFPPPTHPPLSAGPPSCTGQERSGYVAPRAPLARVCTHRTVPAIARIFAAAVVDFGQPIPMILGVCLVYLPNSSCGCCIINQHRTCHTACAWCHIPQQPKTAAVARPTFDAYHPTCLADCPISQPCATAATCIDSLSATLTK